SAPVGGPGDQALALNTVNFDDAPGEVKEVQVTPAGPLAPGYYQLFLAGDQGLHPGAGATVTAPDGTPLRKTAAHPLGQDYALAFQVTGVEGNTTPGAGADDTPAAARELGNVLTAGLVQVTGAIGADPYYNVNAVLPDGITPDPIRSDLGNQADLYHI